MATDEVAELLGQLESRFRPGVLERDISYYLTLGEGPDDKWTVVVGPERCEVRRGKAIERADCVLKTSRELFLRMVREGYTPGMLDIARGRVKSNDPLLLRELKRALGF
ncbi:MAG: hypothetical protein KatS3mg102_1157 [Planctomycetota bacterium]|nr:MAG: hypothetical protein KatS3mg102_1157 [Planctomycetota bacterium]